VAVQPEEPGPEELVLGLELLGLLLKGVDLGREWPMPGDPRTPGVVGQADPACDQKDGVLHESSLRLCGKAGSISQTQSRGRAGQAGSNHVRRGICHGLGQLVTKAIALAIDHPGVPLCLQGLTETRHSFERPAFVQGAQSGSRFGYLA
jgi:hypothetical protein